MKYNSYRGAYFYGSRVKNIHSTDSDFDVVLTFNEKPDWKEKKEIYGIISDFDVENDIIIDAHIYQINDILDPISPFRQNVKNEGIFYAA